MQELTGKRTVPQVFFNDEHVGGATDTLDRIFLWRQPSGEPEESASTPLQRYQMEISGQDDPDDPRLLPVEEIVSLKVDRQVDQKEEDPFLVDSKRRFVLFPIQDEQVSRTAV